MPYKKPEIGKIYYTMGEVSRLFGVNASLIRFWEKEFDIIKPVKNKKGNRLFSPDDLDNLRKIYHLLKEKGYTIQGARDYLKATSGLSHNPLEVVDTLKRIRQMLEDIKREL